MRSYYEYWDDSGYPRDLRETKIHLIGRILAVAYAHDAMTSPHPYRSAYSKEMAIAELKKFAGTQFDAQIVRIFLKILDQAA